MAKYPVNYTLKDLMDQHCITQKVLAEKLVISEISVNRKMNGESEWYFNECLEVAQLLGLYVGEVFIQI